MTFSNPEMLFATPFAVEPWQQERIIDFVLRTGELVGAEENLVEPFWLASGLTTVPEGKKAHVHPDHIGRWTYHMRLNSSLDWYWRDTEITELVQSILAPVAPVYKVFTRVTALLQIPGKTVFPHRDLVPFNHYDRLINSNLTLLGDRELLYEGESWLTGYDARFADVAHRDQGYLNLKVPLTSRPGDPGRPFIVHEGRKFRYDTGGKMFFLNEVNIEHGADPVDFYRGVLFVDGILDMEKFKELKRQPIQAREVTNE